MEVGNLKISVISAKDISAKEIFAVVALYDGQSSMIKSSRRKTSKAKGPPFEWNQSFDFYTTSNITCVKIKLKKKGTFRSSTIGESTLPFSSFSKDKAVENWHKVESKSEPKAQIRLKCSWDKLPEGKLQNIPQPSDAQYKEKKIEKRTKRAHVLFNVPVDEKVIEKFRCLLQLKHPEYGYMFITPNYLLFRSRTKRLQIKFVDISKLQKEDHRIKVTLLSTKIYEFSDFRKTTKALSILTEIREKAFANTYKKRGSVKGSEGENSDSNVKTKEESELENVEANFMTTESSDESSDDDDEEGDSDATETTVGMETAPSLLAADPSKGMENPNDDVSERVLTKEKRKSSILEPSTSQRSPAPEVPKKSSSMARIQSDKPDKVDSSDEKTAPRNDLKKDTSLPEIRVRTPNSKARDPTLVKDKSKRSSVTINPQEISTPSAPTSPIATPAPQPQAEAPKPQPEAPKPTSPSSSPTTSSQQKPKPAPKPAPKKSNFKVTLAIQFFKFFVMSFGIMLTLGMLPGAASPQQIEVNSTPVVMASMMLGLALVFLSPIKVSNMILGWIYRSAAKPAKNEAEYLPTSLSLLSQMILAPALTFSFVFLIHSFLPARANETVYFYGYASSVISSLSFVLEWGLG